MAVPEQHRDASICQVLGDQIEVTVVVHVSQQQRAGAALDNNRAGQTSGDHLPHGTVRALGEGQGNVPDRPGVEVPVVLDLQVLRPGGRLYLPTGSIQDEGAVLRAARRIFGEGRMRQLRERIFPLPAKLGESPVVRRLMDSGVVNFITRRDFNGGEVSAQYGSTGRNDGRQKSASLSWGANSSKATGPFVRMPKPQATPASNHQPRRNRSVRTAS